MEPADQHRRPTDAGDRKARWPPKPGRRVFVAARQVLAVAAKRRKAAPRPAPAAIEPSEEPLVPRPGEDEEDPPMPRRPAVSPEMAFALLHLLLGVVLLTAQFAAAYRSLDRVEPDEASARDLHVGVIATGIVLLGGGVWLSQRISPWVAAAALAGFPLGVVLRQTATTYSQTECWSGWWFADCDTQGDSVAAIHATMTTVAVVALLLALAFRLAIGPRASAGALLGGGMAVAAAFLVASVGILLNLHEEALRAAEANEPVIHETPGLGWVVAAVALLGLAWASRRRG